MKNRLISFFFGASLILSADDIYVPLLGMDPFSAMNFHDASSEISVIHDFLEATGGRLRDDELIVYFSSTFSDSQIARFSFDPDKNNKPIVQVSRLKKDNKFKDKKRTAGKFIFEKARVVELEREKFIIFNNFGRWFSSQKLSADEQSSHPELYPNFQLLTVSNLGVSVIDHTLPKSLVHYYVIASATILSEKDRFRSEEISGKFNKAINEMKDAGTNELLNKIKSSPFVKIQYATTDSETGETDKSLAEIIYGRDPK